MLCPACDKGDCVQITYEDEFQVRGQALLKVAGLEGWHCPECAETWIDGGQSLRNCKRASAARLASQPTGTQMAAKPVKPAAKPAPKPAPKKAPPPKPASLRDKVKARQKALDEI